MAVRRNQPHSAAMIGQDYFDRRARLDSALLALQGIAAENSQGDEPTATINGLIEGLKVPFLLVMVGEDDVEKSILLNALTGVDLSKAGVKPAPEKNLFLQHGPIQKRVSVATTLEEVDVPEDFFRDFSVVDITATDSIKKEHHETAVRFLSTADLVIFVFSALNPWGSSTWDFLKMIHQQLSNNVIFALQHSDQREPEELQSILAYMKRLCGQRLNREFPIFPVSANRAWLARSTGIDCDRLLMESGFNSLEQHISAVISGSSTHHEKLASTIKSAHQIFGSLQAGFEKDNGQRMKRANTLRAIDEGLAAQAQRTFDKITTASEAAATVLQQSVQRTLAAASAQLKSSAVLRSLLRKDWTYFEVETSQQNEPAAAEQADWNRAATVLEEDVSAMADQVRRQLADGLNVQAGDDLKPDVIYWAAQRGRFLAQASGIQQRAFSGLKISQHLMPALASARKLARRQMIFTMVCVIAALILGAAGCWISAGGAVGAAVLAFFVLGRPCSKLLASAFADCESHLAAAPMKMKNLLDQHVRDETENLYERFNKVLQPVREQLDEQERKRVTLQRQIENLDRILQELAAELRPGANLPA
ncbi:MAG: hypothetical protein K8R87_02035 [Verrucomicrobia bacterium]|nr:hypothetical protein [Verrucomicrobiota bacterium]